MNEKEFEPVFKISGTILDRAPVDKDSVLITFCEDGFNDEDGIPYLMQEILSPADGFDKKRILVSYNAEGHRKIESINRENWAEVGIGDPLNIDEDILKYGQYIFHRNALRMNHESFTAPKEELSNIAKKAKYKKLRFIIAGISMNIIWFIFLGLIAIFSADAFFEAENFIMGDAILILSIIAWIILSVYTVKFFTRIPKRIILKMTRCREMMFFTKYTARELSGQKRTFVVAITKEYYGTYGNYYKMQSFPIAVGCETFINDLSNGDIVRSYSCPANSMMDLGNILIKNSPVK